MFWSKVKLLLWKNFLIRKRSLLRNIVEVVWPLTIFLIILGSRMTKPPIYLPEDAKDSIYFIPRALPSAGFLPFVHSLICHYRVDKIFTKPQEVPNLSQTNFYKLVQILGPIFTNASALQKIQDFFMNLASIYNNITDDFKAAEVPFASFFANTPEATASLKFFGQLENNTVNALLQSKLKIGAFIYVFFNWRTKSPEKELNEYVCTDDKLESAIDFPSTYNKTLIVSDICKHFKQVLVALLLIKKDDYLTTSTKNLSFIQDFESKFQLLSNAHNPFYSQGIYNNSQLSDFWKLIEPISELAYSWQNLFNVNFLLCKGPPSQSYSERLDNSMLDPEPIVEPLQENDQGSCKIKFKKFIESLKISDDKSVTDFLLLIFSGKILYSPNNQKTNQVIQKLQSFMSMFLSPFSHILEMKSLLKTILNITEKFEPDEIFDKVKLILPISTSIIKSIPKNITMYNITDKEIDKLEEFTVKVLKFIETSKVFRRKIKIIHYIAHAALRYYENLASIFDCYINSHYFIPFDTEEELTNYASKESNFFSSIVFLNVNDDGPFPKKVEYKLRFKPTFSPSTSNIKSSYWTPGPGPLRSHSFWHYEYINFGFVFLQDLVERALTELISNKTVSQPGIYAQQFPYPRYVKDSFYDLAMCMPLCITISWIYSFMVIIKNIVYEKETKLKEVMKVMGLNDFVHWTAWFITSIIFMSFSIFPLAAILKLGNILLNSDVTLVIFVMLIFACANIALAFLCSIFFSNTSIAVSCGGLLYLFTFLPYVFVGNNTHGEASFGSLSFMCLFSTSSFSMVFKYIFIWEDQGIGAHWSNFYQSPFPNDTFSIGWAVNFMIIDFFLYVLFIIYFLQVLPGEHGKSKVWYFLLTKSYWNNSFTKLKYKPFLFKNGYTKINNLPDTNVDNSVDFSEIQNHDLTKRFEKEPSGLKVGIQLVNLVKIYPRGNKHAVDHVSLKMYEGQVTILLGHNGAGKSSIMSILTGFLKPTSGNVLINGVDICTSIKRAHKGLGWCPQSNVLFDNLTVEEHILFYGKLKGLSRNKIRSKAERFLIDVGLEKKRHELSCNLSGGMKRQLSIALAFIGKSKVVILDEPTSGVDPYARRGIWDLVLKYKAGRTVLLSTHYMNEADTLGDRISILSNGKLKCSGSSLFLKQHFTKGYILTILLDANSFYSPADILNFICSFVPGASLDKTLNLELKFILPSIARFAGEFENLFHNLDKSMSKLGILSYGLADSTLEEVFLQACYDKSNTGSIESCEVSDDESSFSSSDDTNNSSELVEKPQPQFFAARALWFEQYQALLTKRFYHSIRNIKGVTSEIVLPTIFVIIAMCTSLFQTNSFVKPSLKLSTEMFSKPNYIVVDVPSNSSYLDNIMKSYVEYPAQDGKRQNFSSFIPLLHKNKYKVPSGASRFCTDKEKCVYSPTPTMLRIGNGDIIINITGYDINQYLLSTTNEYIDKRYGGVSFVQAKSDLPCASSSSSSCGALLGMKNSVKVWYNLKGYHALPVYLNSINNAILRANIPTSDDPSQYGIIGYNHPMSLKILSKEDSLNQALTDLLVAAFMILAISFIPASFLVYLVEDRAKKCKQLQIISGLNPVVYWFGNFTWDLISYLIPAFTTIFIFLLFNQKAYVSSQNFPATFLLLMLYGWSMIPLMYPMSFVFDVPSNAYIVMIKANLFVGIVGTLSTFILDTVAQGSYGINEVLKQVLLIFPNFCLGRGIMDLAANQHQSDAFEVFGLETFRDPFSWDITGRNLFAMAISGFIYFAITLLFQFNFFIKPWTSTVKEGLLKDVKDDVIEEEECIVKEKSQGKPFTLRVSLLSKMYKDHVRNSNTLAVNQITFGVKHGECFGLLGVNGAGKSSTFKMLTGDVSITDGDAFVNDHSIHDNLTKVYRSIGYCPQSDAFDELLTAKELLVYFSRLRGFNKSESNKLANWALHKLGLFEYKDRICCDYSGGNKRKVSTAIALIGTPSLILLDEPTTGMDPGAQKFLWNVIKSFLNDGKSILITSHNMEECENLCSQIAIMVDGEFKCIGTPQHLKNKYSLGYIIIIRCKTQLFDDVDIFMKSNLLEVDLKFRQHKTLEYHYPYHYLKLAQVFSKLELLRKTLPIDDYSVSQSTLEQVFVDFARSQDKFMQLDAKKECSLSVSLRNDTSTRLVV